ncbi:haloacid dehalogenase [Chromobacterium violaceum]|uniref:HAD family hydrolase n=1 Tax=Chromobacterium violaceum TaxID=536 RepID=UPI000C1266F3|nr:HAD family phosphatase [Chromobacterium violaceum]ATP28060.1 haloacid dehalogenase [Chromobacterium violaceum]ATP31970.1 haloacid dehalogenase [Chromobacterium violaceum]
MSQADFSLLFDLDGTLVDTDILHFGAYQTLLADHKRSITMQIYKERIMGAPNDAIMRELFPDLSKDSHRRLAERKEELFRAAIGKLEPTPGALALFEWAEARRVPIAVVTNAPRTNAERMLAGLDLLGRIDALVIGEELPRGKPDPLPYLTGLQRLNGRPERALAFEDSLSGVRAATAAGIHTFGVGAALPAESLRGAGADEVIADFTAAELWRRLDALELSAAAEESGA